VWIGLLTDITDAEAGTVQEVTGSGTLYTRVSGSFVAPANGETSNSIDLTFPQAGAAWGNVMGFGLYNQQDTGSGDLYYVGLLGDPQQTFFGANVAGPTNDVLWAANHSLVQDDPVRLATGPGDILPSPLSEDTTYYVSASIPSPTENFYLSATVGGDPVTITSSGSALFIKLNSRDIQVNDTAEFAAGSLVVSEF